ncbi:DAPG hydrolase family protein [Clostridium thailandense]|uniref:DAPG hydrolase family protein n=1 Tax=Clostridium thailandense TaxID=2794346 RepID=UPI003989EBF6
MAVTITEKERELSYAKYWDRDLAPVHEDKLAISKGPSADPRKALKVENRNDFICGKDNGVNIGFCVMEDGTAFVANEAFWPGVTKEMFDWWFGWHSLEDLRYKIWDKEDHYYARADKPDYVRNPEVPVSQKTWGVNHDILEDIGLGEPDKLLLCFKCPSDLGYDLSKVGTKDCAAMVCAVGEGKAPALMTHMCQEVDGGIIFKSRFWMGYGLVNGEVVKVVPEGVTIPEIVPRSLFSHTIKEYANLAAILPELYAEEKDNW